MTYPITIDGEKATPGEYYEIRTEFVCMNCHKPYQEGDRVMFVTFENGASLRWWHRTWYSGGVEIHCHDK